MTEAVEDDVESFRAGESRPPDFRGLLQGGGKRNTPVLRRVVGDVTSGWEDSGRFAPQGGPLAGKGAAEEYRVGWVDYPPLYAALKAVGMEEVDTYVLKL